MNKKTDSQTKTIDNLFDEPINSQDESKSLYKRVADWYFEPKGFEKDGKIYEKLGVKYVQKAVMGTGGLLRRLISGGTHADNYFIGQTRDTESLLTFISGTRFNEGFHTPVAIYFGLRSIYLLSAAEYVAAGFAGLVATINFALCMLQRYNRARVLNIIDRRKKHTEKLEFKKSESKKFRTKQLTKQWMKSH